jgi:hypothetical protein
VLSLKCFGERAEFIGGLVAGEAQGDDGDRFVSGKLPIIMARCSTG